MANRYHKSYFPKSSIKYLVRGRIRKNLEFSPRLFFCLFVTFSETLPLVRTYKRGKMFHALFWKNPVSPILAKKFPKMEFLDRRMLIRKNLEFSTRSSIRPFENISKSVHYFFMKLCS